MIELHGQNLHLIRNPEFKRYAEIYTNINRNYLEQITSTGITLAEEENPVELTAKRASLKQQGAIFRNQDKSIYLNWLSSACEACKTGQESITLFLSLRCHRNCFYCFNPNQEDYDLYATTKNDCISQLQAIAKSGQKIKHIALTGGEPLLYKEEMLAFFSLARSKYRQAHLRLYTSGDLLDLETLQMLKEIGLNEIRFSIKLEDELATRKKVLSKIALAKEYIQDVMVEMPVIPGTQAEMESLLLELDKLMISGINLLEFCYPFNNVQEFIKRYYQIKNPPFEVLYNYWYAGGLPISGSEKESLELLQFALNKGLHLGLHYCSVENKHTGQIYQQNVEHTKWRNVYFSQKDYFLKTAKVFGRDISKVLKVFKKKGILSTLDKENGFLEFHLKDIKSLNSMDLEIGISSNVIEERNKVKYLRELKIDLIHPDEFTLEDI